MLVVNGVVNVTAVYQPAVQACGTARLHNRLVHHFAPESKRHSMEWKHPGSPVKKTFKSHPSVGKVILTIFWDSQGLILEHYLERGTTVNSVRYSDMLSTELKRAI